MMWWAWYWRRAADRSLSWSFGPVWGFSRRGDGLCGAVWYFRLWRNGPGLDVRTRPYRLLFSERNGMTRVHEWGPICWKVLR